MDHPGAARKGSPQAHRDPHPVGAPALGKGLELGKVRFGLEPVLGADRPHQPSLLRRQLVHSTQRTQPDQLRPELTDSRQLLQTLE